MLLSQLSWCVILSKKNGERSIVLIFTDEGHFNGDNTSRPLVLFGKQHTQLPREPNHLVVILDHAVIKRPMLLETCNDRTQREDEVNEMPLALLLRIVEKNHIDSSLRSCV